MVNNLRKAEILNDLRSRIHIVGYTYLVILCCIFVLCHELPCDMYIVIYLALPCDFAMPCFVFHVFTCEREFENENHKLRYPIPAPR